MQERGKGPFFILYFKKASEGKVFLLQEMVSCNSAK